MSSDQIISIGHIDRWADTREEQFICGAKASQKPQSPELDGFAVG